MSEAGAGLWSGLAANLAAGTRLSLFLRVRREAFHVTAGQYAMVVGASLAAWLAGGLLRNGLSGAFNLAALVAGLGQLPLVLLVCLLAATLLRERALLLAFAVVITATDPVFELVAVVLSRLAGVEAIAAVGPLINEAYTLWGALVLMRALHLLAGWRGARTLGAAILFLGLQALFLSWFPRAELWSPLTAEAPAPAGLMQEQVFHLQGALLDDQLAELEDERGGITDLYFLGLATDASQPGSIRELSAMRGALDQHFDTTDRGVVLANSAETLTRLPVASATNLADALGELGAAINPEEDVVLLYLTGRTNAAHELAFTMPPLVLDPINPTVLARMLADSGIKWRVIVLSACHAAGFIEPLRDDNSLIIAASGADQSQDCEAGESPSAFGQAFSQALGNTRSLPDAFSAARSAIGAKEGDASGPQMHLGRAMKDKLAALQRRLESQDPARPAVQALLAR